jgi:hypothetical protein
MKIDFSFQNKNIKEKYLMDQIVVTDRNRKIIFSDAGLNYHKQTYELKKERQKRRKKNTKVDYSVFQEMLDYIKENKKETEYFDFWEHQLSLLCNCNLPKNIVFDGKILKHNSKNNKKSKLIELFSKKENEKISDPLNNFNELKNFLKSLDIVPSEERDQDEDKINETYKIGEMYQDEKINSFKELKKLQETAILLFQKRTLEKNKIRDVRVENSFVSLLNTGFSSKIFNDDNIIVEKGIIKEITVLEYDKKGNFFFINIDKIKEIKKKTLTKRKIGSDDSHTFTNAYDYTMYNEDLIMENENEKDLNVLSDLYFTKLMNKIS